MAGGVAERLKSHTPSYRNLGVLDSRTTTFLSCPAHRNEKLDVPDMFKHLKSPLCLSVCFFVFGLLTSAAAQTPTPHATQSTRVGDKPTQTVEQNLERQCASGDQTACESLFHSMTQGCERNDAHSCYILGKMKRHGLATKPDLGTALEILEKGCGLKSVDACIALARTFYDGLNTRSVALEQDTRNGMIRQYLKYLEAACELQSGRACVQRGQVAQAGELFAPDTFEARIYFRKACLLGEDWGCRRFGASYEINLSTVSFDTDAIEVLRQGCTANMPTACIYLATGYAQPSGVPHDERRATELFDKACTLKSPWGCNNFADRLMNGQGILPDPQRAVVLYRAACEEADAMACHHLANLHGSGIHGVQKDSQRALELHTKACALGCPPCCTELADIYATGMSTAPNTIKAESLYEKACKSGDTLACTKLKSLQDKRP